jgi:hypothetical protein
MHQPAKHLLTGNIACIQITVIQNNYHVCDDNLMFDEDESDNIKQDINKNVYSELSAYDALLE